MEPGYLPTISRPVWMFFVTFVIGFILHLLGISTVYWIKAPKYHTGLWRACFQGNACISNPYTAAWFEATQTFEVIGLIAGFIALILIILFIFISQTAGNRTLFLIALATVYTACGSTVVGVIIYGSQSVNLSWSFGLTVIAGIAYGLAGGLMVMLIFKD